MASSFPVHLEADLVTLVEERPALWQIKHHDYHKKDVRERLFGEIALELGVEVAAVKAKWNSLRSAFAREQRKTLAKRSGDGGDQAYVSSWTHFKRMSFIASGNPRSGSDSSLDKSSSSPLTPTPAVQALLESTQRSVATVEDDDERHEVSRVLIEEDLEPVDTQSTARAEHFSPVSTHGAQPRKRARTATEQSPTVLERRTVLLQAAIDRLNRPAATCQTDEVDDYVKRLANVLRRVPSGAQREKLFHALMTKALNTVFEMTDFGIEF
ncbi:uncharacterized protein LOC135375935 [Ornithodoros turicata]|uniref:uncharacterized protein LOC135375935 n=1 Tax=Ornithodoros turicata TaxID=34597 RepID=UPI003138BC32